MVRPRRSRRRPKRGCWRRLAPSPKTTGTGGAVDLGGAGHASARHGRGGRPSLTGAHRQRTVHALARAPIRPDKINYYLQRRDPEFDRKMREVLIVYRQVEELFQQPAPPPGTPRVVTVSVDEKPGVQALATTAPDLPPVPGRHPTVGRDYGLPAAGHGFDPRRLGFAGRPCVAQGRPPPSQRRVCAGLLRDLDAYPLPEVTIRVLLDNHSAHISKETMAYLATRPNRFVLCPHAEAWVVVEAWWKRSSAKWPAPSCGASGSTTGRNSRTASSSASKKSTKRRWCIAGAISPHWKNRHNRSPYMETLY